MSWHVLHWAGFALGGCADHRRIVGYRPPIGAGDRPASFVAPRLFASCVEDFHWDKPGLLTRGC